MPLVTPLAVSKAQPQQRAKRAADPRRESTAMFSGFSACSAESGLLEIDEIVDINGSPEIVRHLQPAPANPHTLISSAHSSPSSLGTSHETGASLAAGSAAASCNYVTCHGVAPDNNAHQVSRLAETCQQQANVADEDAAQQQSSQQQEQSRHQQLQHSAQQPYQLPSEQQQQPANDHRSHLAQQQPAEVAQLASLCDSKLGAQATPALDTEHSQPSSHAVPALPALHEEPSQHDSHAVPVLDVERSSPRLQALAAANLPAGDEHSDEGLGRPTGQLGRVPQDQSVADKTTALLPDEVR